MKKPIPLGPQSVALHSTGRRLSHSLLSSASNRIGNFFSRQQPVTSPSTGREPSQSSSVSGAQSGSPGAGIISSPSDDLLLQIHKHCFDTLVFCCREIVEKMETQELSEAQDYEVCFLLIIPFMFKISFISFFFLRRL